MTTIYHDPDRWEAEVALVTSKGKAFAYIDVVARDSNPEELLAVVYDYSHNGNAYSNGKVYRKYQHAFAAIGAAFDRYNPEHEPLNDRY